MRRAKRLFAELHPLLVAGFGGYPTLPPLYAATRLKIPTLIHEQNAVMGRANRFLSGRVDAIAGGFLEKKGRYAQKMTLTGNPLRGDIIKAAFDSYQPPYPDGAFHLLVFGGSQGASFFSNILPQALTLLTPDERSRLKITQQVRPADLERLTKAYKDLDIDAEIASFFNPMAGKIAQAHLIIARSGASTVAEIAAIGRPSLLVPYPGAIDHDQAANAQLLAQKGGAQLVHERDLTAGILSDFLKHMMNEPGELAEMAMRAKAAGYPQATSDLADLVEKIIIEGKRHENAA